MSHPDAKMAYRHRYSPRLRVSMSNFGKSLTKQSEKQSCDINFIIDRYRQSGFLPQRDGAYYGEFADINYQEALNTVIEAQNAFSELPSAVRTKFGNDPAAFVEFAANPENHQAMYDLGLLTKPPSLPNQNTEARKGQAKKGDSDPVTESE